RAVAARRRPAARHTENGRNARPAVAANRRRANRRAIGVQPWRRAGRGGVRSKASSRQLTRARAPIARRHYARRGLYGSSFHLMFPSFEQAVALPAPGSRWPQHQYPAARRLPATQEKQERSAHTLFVIVVLA